jgi:bifunctional non-homologous end joining protein LigD
MAKADPLDKYRSKRNFGRTPEPDDESKPSGKSGTTRSFVIQKHAARNLHYDFRLELGGTLRSWAVPKGPSLDPGVKRMGVHVEDHPLSYAGFEGTIPTGQYGAGDVIVWDRGTWTAVGNAEKSLEQGKLKFELHGEKLKGGWTLVRMCGRAESGDKAGGHEPWLLIKEKDAHARPADQFDVLQALPNSVLTGRNLPEKAASRSGLSAAKPARNHAAKKVAAAGPADEPLPAGAVRATLPAALSPQLATLAESPPAGLDNWSWEIKFDGYRLLARIEGETVQCFTRNGHDWSGKMPALTDAIRRLGLQSAWLDGEIVVLDQRGLPDFGALQNAFDRGRSKAPGDLVYYLFDLPFFDGLDLRGVPLSRRRDILRTAITECLQDAIRFSESFDAPPGDLLNSAHELGLEGLIGKRIDSSYSSRRSPDWIKLKTRLRQEFVIGGYTAPQGTRTGLGALLLGVHDEQGKLRYAGNVGTGFDERMLRELKEKFVKLHTARDPFDDLPSSVKAQWIKPQLLAEVAFGEWTAAGRIRHSVFIGLRADKPAREIVREATGARATGAPATPQSAAARPVKVRVTHPGRVIDTQTGFTKQQLIDYYEAVGGLILPHLHERPVALVRAPEGVGGEVFFQKHAAAKTIPGVKLLPLELDPGHAPLLEIDSPRALLEAAQLNVVELHTWNATHRAINQPDRMTFDLDPGEGIAWPQMQQAALLVRTMLDELGLASFLKTSGGKGLHVVVPLKKPGSSSPDFDTVKRFSQAIVQHLAKVLPQTFVAKSGPKNRVGKIYVDYLRNGFGATTVSAWSVRVRPGLGVSVPVAWDELESLTGGANWSVATIAGRLAIGNRPWEGYDASRSTLADSMKKLGFRRRLAAK